MPKRSLETGTHAYRYLENGGIEYGSVGSNDGRHVFVKWKDGSVTKHHAKTGLALTKKAGQVHEKPVWHSSPEDHVRDWNRRKGISEGSEHLEPMDRNGKRSKYSGYVGTVPHAKDERLLALKKEYRQKNKALKAAGVNARHEVVVRGRAGKNNPNKEKMSPKDWRAATRASVPHDLAQRFDVYVKTRQKRLEEISDEVLRSYDRKASMESGLKKHAYHMAKKKDKPAAKAASDKAEKRWPWIMKARAKIASRNPVPEVKEKTYEPGEIGEYKRRLDSHDWHYEMSDSHGVYKRGRENQTKLKIEAKKSPEHQKAFDERNPYHRGGK